MKQTNVLGLPNSRGFSVNTSTMGNPVGGLRVRERSSDGTPVYGGAVAHGGEMRSWGSGGGLCPGKNQTRARPRLPATLTSSSTSGLDRVGT